MIRAEEDVGNEITWDVRRRIHEIMGGQLQKKSRNCDQSTLQTTYDVSPTNSPTHGKKKKIFRIYFKQDSNQDFV